MRIRSIYFLSNPNRFGRIPRRSRWPVASPAVDASRDVAASLESTRNTARRPFAALVNLLLTTDRRRRFQLMQTLAATFLLSAGVVALIYLTQRGLADAGQVTAVSLLLVPGWIGFFVAIRTGITQRFADPAMTLWQMVFGVVGCAGAYSAAGAARGAVFAPLMTILMFNIFSLSLRQTIGVIGWALAVFAAVMSGMVWQRPNVYVPTVEWVHFWMLATMMPVAAVLAWQLQTIRFRLRERTQALEVSLERNRYLATRDELTGLINRRHLLELIERDHLRTARSSVDYCLALIDLDHFKRVNDRYGHAAGDAVLQAFAREAGQQLRTTDALGRWGGEEFLLLMPDASLPAACKGIERLRRAWVENPAAHGGATLHSTFSAGVVQRREGESVTQTIERADAALYRAKSNGRDRVVFEH